MSLSLASIVDVLGGTLSRPASLQIESIAPLSTAGPGDISFLSQARYRPQLLATAAACVIVRPDDLSHVPDHSVALVVDDPYLYYARLSQFWRQHHAPVPAQIHSSAVIDPGAFIAPGASIGPLCVVEAGARIGAGTRLASRVTVGHHCQIGERCLVHSGVVIGADGFGFAPNQGRWEKIEQLGTVRIGNDVEIGANTCIDRDRKSVV